MSYDRQLSNGGGSRCPLTVSCQMGDGIRCPMTVSCNNNNNNFLYFNRITQISTYTSLHCGPAYPITVICQMVDDSRCPIIVSFKMGYGS